MLPARMIASGYAAEGIATSHAIRRVSTGAGRMSERSKRVDAYDTTEQDQPRCHEYADIPCHNACLPMLRKILPDALVFAHMFHVDAILPLPAKYHELACLYTRIILLAIHYMSIAVPMCA